jgi:hypothetical protein
MSSGTKAITKEIHRDRVALNLGPSTRCVVKSVGDRDALRCLHFGDLAATHADWRFPRSLFDILKRHA